MGYGLTGHEGTQRSRGTPGPRLECLRALVPGDLRDPALPHRLRHRRGARHGHRHRAGLADRPTIALAVALAFVFGYAFTIGRCCAPGLALRAASQVALAADTVSITVMEIVDNAIMLPSPARWTPGWPAACSGAALAVRARRRVRRDRPRQPLADRPRQGPRRRPRLPPLNENRCPATGFAPEPPKHAERGPHSALGRTSSNVLDVSPRGRNGHHSVRARCPARSRPVPRADPTATDRRR